MSNIYTEHARLYFRPGMTLERPEIEKLLDNVLTERGSYWVPVWYELAPWSHVDLQYGSGKAASLFNLEVEDLQPFEEIWVRFADEGADYDVIYEWFPALDETPHDGYPRKRNCRYMFDEINVFLHEQQRRAWVPGVLPWQPMRGGFRAPFWSIYWALNERSDMEIGPGARLASEKRTPGGLPTLTTPSHGTCSLSMDLVHAEIVELAEHGHPSIARVDLLYSGRVVHRAEWIGSGHDKSSRRWAHYTADHWDNCSDQAFVHSPRYPKKP
ncbi:MAG TPA: hypothetical protein PK156_10100 [Polyangium sp.]|nr:hypothetical protein [Polyangium sp.]